MVRKPRTPARITADEKQTIDRIVVVCSSKIYHFLKTHRDPKKYASKLLKLWSSEKALFLPNLLFATMSMNANELIFPQELKMKVAKATTHEDVSGAILNLEKRQSTYLKSWAATEAFQDLVNEGLLSNISGKRNIKKIAPPQKLKKGRGYDDIKREGLYSAYMITEDLGVLNKIVSKHEALKIIHQKLIKYGKLEEFFLFNGLAAVHAMMKSDDKVNKLFNVAAQSFLDNSPEVQTALSRAGLNSKEIQYSLWEPIKNYLGSLKEEELEGIVREMIHPLVENPIDYRYTLLAICRS
jgi:hypothetical protein